MPTPIVKRLLLVSVPLAALACAGARAPVRRLPVVDEMPAAPERASETVPAGDLVSFYPRAPSALASGPDLERFGIECSVPITMRDGKGFFTLALRDDRREALFAFTPEPVTDLGKTLSVSPGSSGKSMDWGFVYDRNGDGWADYIAFLFGPMPVGTPEILAQVPARPAPQLRPEGGATYRITREEYALQVASTRLVFNHFADDGFDGKADAIVSALMDPDRWGWIHRRAVVRSRAHSLVVDEDWVFVQDIAAREGPVPRGPDGRFVALEGLGSTREDHLAEFTQFFEYVNAGLRGCRIPRGALPRD